MTTNSVVATHRPGAKVESRVSRDLPRHESRRPTRADLQERGESSALRRDVDRGARQNRLVGSLTVVGSGPSHSRCHGLFPHSASIFRRTSSLILISGGHGLLNPSPASLCVASIPSFVPIAISEAAWSKTSAGPFVKIESRWGSVFAHSRNSTSPVL